MNKAYKAKKVSKFLTVNNALDVIRNDNKKEQAKYENSKSSYDSNLKYIINWIKTNYPDIDYLTSLIASIAIFQVPSITSSNRKYSGIYYSIVLRPKHVNSPLVKPKVSPFVDDKIFEEFLKKLYTSPSSSRPMFKSSDTSYVIREHINKLFDTSDIHFQLFEGIKSLIELGFFFVTFDRTYSRFYIFNPSYITVSYPETNQNDTVDSKSESSSDIFDYTKFVSEVFQAEVANIDNRLVINSDTTNVVINVYPGSDILDEDPNFDTGLFTPVKEVFGSDVKLTTNEGVELDVNRTYIISSSTQLLFGESKYKKLYPYLQKIQILESANLIERLVKSKIYNLILVDISKLDEEDIPYQLKTIENELANHEISTSIFTDGISNADLEKLAKNLAVIPVEGNNQITIEHLKGEYKPIYYDIYYYWNKVYSILGIPPYYHANALEQLKSVPKEAIKIHDLNFSSNILKYQTIVNKFLKELLRAYFKNYFEVVWIDVALPPFTPPSKESEVDMRNLKTFVDTVVELENLLGIQLKKEFILQYLFPEHSPEEIVVNNDTQKSIIEEVYDTVDSTDTGLINEVKTGVNNDSDDNVSASSLIGELQKYAKSLNGNDVFTSKFAVNLNSLKSILDSRDDELFIDIGFISF